MTEEKTNKGLTRSQLRKLAASLCQVLSVREGNELVFLLGLGTEKNNKEAIQSWVENELNDTQLLMGDETVDYFEHIKQRLSRRLHQIGGNAS